MVTIISKVYFWRFWFGEMMYIHHIHHTFPPPNVLTTVYSRHANTRCGKCCTRECTSYVHTDIPQVAYVFHINMQTPKTSLVWPDPFLHRALLIRDDKCPRKKGLVQFIGLTGTETTVVVGGVNWWHMILSTSTLLELLYEVMDSVKDNCGLCGLATNRPSSLSNKSHSTAKITDLL